MLLVPQCRRPASRGARPPALVALVAQAALSTVLGWAAAAGAAPPSSGKEAAKESPAAAGPAAKDAKDASVLVLAIQQEGVPSGPARESIVAHLRRMGESVQSPALPAADLLCVQSECLERIGKRHAAQRLLGGEITPNGNNYLVALWLYDREDQSTVPIEDRCIDCSLQDLSDLLARTSGRLLESRAAMASAPTPAREPGVTNWRSLVKSQPSAAPPPATELTMSASWVSTRGACQPPYTNFKRGVAIGALGGILLSGVVTAATLTAFDGRVYQPATVEPPSPELRYHLTPHYGLAYGFSALSALGLSAALLPWQRVLRKAKDPVLPVCTASPRWGWNRGLAVGALSGLSLTGLVSAIALTALNGHVYGMTADGGTLVYSTSRHYTAAWAVSSALVAGLSISLVIP